MSSKLRLYLNSSALFSEPSFLKGFARVADLFGVLDEYSCSDTGNEADLIALERDWGVVGIDIANAIEEYDKITMCSENTSPTAAR